jgi:hypothetical protein
MERHARQAQRGRGHPRGLTGEEGLQHRGIRVNAVCPGTIETPMISDMIAKGELDRATAMKDRPIGRLGDAEEIAAAVLWLCSPAARFVVGVALPVDGGYTARCREDRSVSRERRRLTDGQPCSSIRPGQQAPQPPLRSTLRSRVPPRPRASGGCRSDRAAYGASRCVGRG